MVDNPAVGSSPATGVYRDMVKAQLNLRETQDTRLRTVYAELLKLTGELAPEWLEARRIKSLAEIEIDELYPVLREKIALLKMIEAVGAKQELLNRAAAFADENKRLETENRRLRSDIDKAREQLQEQVKVGEREVRKREDGKNKERAYAPASQPAQNASQPLGPTGSEPLPSIERIPVSPIPMPEWITEWSKSPAFAWEALVIQVIGETGLAEQPHIIKEARQRKNVSKNNTSAFDALERMSSAPNPLVIRRRADGSITRGSPPYIVTLTERGQDAFIFLTNQRPAETEFTSKMHHKSDVHTMLNNHTKDILRTAGYEILADNEIVELTGKHRFQPDITARDQNGKVIYIEVERDANKGDRMARNQKWINVCDATGGNIYLVFENAKNQESILSEIRSALQRKTCRLLAFNFEQGPAADGTVWTYEKELL